MDIYYTCGNGIADNICHNDIHVLLHSLLKGDRILSVSIYQYFTTINILRIPVNIQRCVTV